MRTCERCKGIGHLAADAYGSDRDCYNCDGIGHFPLPDYALIESLVVNPKTNKPWSTSFHSAAGRKRLDNTAIVAPYAAGGTVTRPDKQLRRRIQYVWRMALWNSGQDGRGYNLGGAVMAGMDLGNDPYRAELDGLADKIAERCYGQGASLRAGVRWRQAMYGR